MTFIRFIALLSAIILAAASCGSEITVIYPRSATSGQSYIYAGGIDSTFILGHVSPPVGTLTINGDPVAYTDSGAFLAWLPLRKDSANHAWELRLTDGDLLLSERRVPYDYQSDVLPHTAGMDTLANLSFPLIVRVSQRNAHLRTHRGGSYFLFPDSGTALKAIDYASGFFDISLAGERSAVIESRFVAIEPDSILPAARIGNAICRSIDHRSVCSFAASRPVAWRAETVADGKTLILQLFGAYSAIERIRFDVNDRFLRDITWDQNSDLLEIEFRCASGINGGYAVRFADDSLFVSLRAPYGKENRSLRGKRIVIDAGHGGESDGAIGPLGTKEKDVTLRLALDLKNELTKRGADVRMTRESDVALGLYERIDFARSVNADFLISLHANALPDDENPFLRHGSGTYYYHSTSRNAAEAVHRQLIKAVALRDDGLYDANLALVRPTDFPALLIESAYLIYPAEEELLRSNIFCRRLAKGLSRGLADYFEE